MYQSRRHAPKPKGTWQTTTATGFGNRQNAWDGIAGSDPGELRLLADWGFDRLAFSSEPLEYGSGKSSCTH